MVVNFRVDCTKLQQGHVGRNVPRRRLILQKLSSVHYCFQWEKNTQAITTANSCTATIPDYWCGCNGASQDNQGNKYLLVFQEKLTKWPMVFPLPNQRSIRLFHLLVDEVIPMFGVPEALLSDRGTNLLSHLMLDVCELLGIKKLNTTAYHPQCDGMVESTQNNAQKTCRFIWEPMGQICLLLRGLITTPHMNQQGRNPHFCYSDLIAGAYRSCIPTC